jgi:hypothetical protein
MLPLINTKDHFVNKENKFSEVISLQGYSLSQLVPLIMSLVKAAGSLLCVGFLEKKTSPGSLPLEDGNGCFHEALLNHCAVNKSTFLS